jgi:glycosyltransferase involved in cell wall biosynthesis
MNVKLSLVVPCYNEQDNVEAFYDAAKAVFDAKDYSYEMIFINDGSKDETAKKLKELYQKKSANMLVVNFSRNFGKEAAIYAGLKKSCGEMVAIIDADLQQRPEIVADMVRILDENEEYDCVAAFQETRSEGRFVSWMKDSFYNLVNKTSEVDFRKGASDFRTLRRCMVDAILEMPEYHRFSKGIFSWVGFETFFIPYVAEARHAGETKWSIKKLFKYAMEGFISFTTFPLKIATGIGLFTSAAAIIYMIVVVIQYLIYNNPVPGYPTIVVLILLLGGIQLTILGIIGEYLARMYIQGKDRPIFIAKSILDYHEEE